MDSLSTSTSTPTPSELNFDGVIRVEIPFTFGGKKYFLVEASEGAAIDYQNACMKGMKLGSDGKPISMGENLGEVSIILLQNCVYSADDNGSLRKDSFGLPDSRYRVHPTTLRNWPSRVVSPLFKQAKKISNLDPTPTRDDLFKAFCEAQANLDAWDREHHTGAYEEDAGREPGIYSPLQGVPNS